MKPTGLVRSALPPVGPAALRRRLIRRAVRKGGVGDRRKERERAGWSGPGRKVALEREEEGGLAGAKRGGGAKARGWSEGERRLVVRG